MLHTLVLIRYFCIQHFVFVHSIQFYCRVLFFFFLSWLFVFFFAFCCSFLNSQFFVFHVCECCNLVPTFMVRVIRNMTQSEVACDDFRNSKSMSCSMYLSHSCIVSISVDSFVSNAISFFRLFLILCSAFQAEKRLIAIKRHPSERI